MTLGAVLAGGQSSRFGSDKALAVLYGQTLLTRAVATLAQWCDTVVVVGRTEAPPPRFRTGRAPRWAPWAVSPPRCATARPPAMAMC